MRGQVKKLVLTVVAVLLIISLAACSKTKNQGNSDEEEEPIVVIVDPVEEENYEGLAISPLTGLYIDEEIAKRRPVAIMINNIRVALPQSGISQAEVIYETLAEGNITRLLAVFQNFDTEKIGPVRSARHYYIDLAFNHDAVFIHYGGSPQAFESIKKLKVDNLNGLSYLDNIMFWRDPVRKSQRGMYEHSVYTSTEKIMIGWDRVKLRKDLKEDSQTMFSFAKDEWTPQGQVANRVDLPFTNQITTGFQYDENTKMYKREQYNQPHIDENTNEQLETKNIIVQYTSITHIPGDKEGRRDVQLVGSGKGTYITNGKAMPITWSKKDHYAPTIYKDEQGQQLEMNKGNTWIIIFPNNREIQLN